MSAGIVRESCAVRWPPERGERSEVVDVVVLVVNFRTAELTLDCLRTLEAELAAVRMHVVVVDNASGDGSAARLKEAIRDLGWAGWCTLVESDRNLGFAGGNNAALAAAPDSRFVFMLNSDTRVRPGTVGEWVAFMTAHRGVGAFCGRLSHVDGTLQVAGRKFPTPARVVFSALGLPWRLPRLFGWADTEYRGWDMSTRGGDVDWLGGAAVLVRSEVVKAGGLLDTDFFFYGEDVEFSHRVWRSGWRCRFEPLGEVVHLGGASSDPARLPMAARSVHVWRGRYLVQRKCFGRWAEWLARATDTVLTGARLAVRVLSGRGGTDEAASLRQTFALLRRPLREHIS